MTSTTRDNSMSMQSEIQELVERIAPAKGIAGGFMSRQEIIQLISKVADEAVIIGWARAETMSRNRLEKKITSMEQEIDILKDKIKDLELDLIAASK
jgi:hypothetical protein